MNSYIVATEKIWNLNNYHKYFDDKKDFNLIFVDEKGTSYIKDGYGLCENYVSFEDTCKSIKPTLIFFPHWNNMIPKEIYEKFECVIFHMTDLPFGRGKEPLQWLIESGYQSTMLTVFKCTDKIDRGPIYNKILLPLNGSAEEIYKRCSDLIFQEIIRMIESKCNPIYTYDKMTLPTPMECGHPTPEILLDAIDNLDELYHKIRAWDAESYPKANFDIEEFNFEFSNAVMRHDCIEAIVKIRINE